MDFISNFLWILTSTRADDDFSGPMDTNVKLRYNGEITWDAPAITKSSCVVDVSYFPFDSQECNLTFGSWTYNGNQVLKDTLMGCMSDLSSSPVSFLFRLTSLWEWTAATCQTLWKMWSGSAVECRQPRTSSCTAAAPTRTRTSPTPCCCRGVPPFTSSTSSSPASSSPSWLLWVSTCLQTRGRRFPSGWLFFWLSLCSSWWWLRACLHRRACRL